MDGQEGGKMFKAVQNNNMTVVSKLLESGHDVNAHYGGNLMVSVSILHQSNMQTPLQCAVTQNNEEMVKFLLENGIQF